MLSEQASEGAREENQMRPGMVSRRLITLGFGLSGAAALIYEVTWTRELSLVFSSTVYAVSVMLAAFMAGLSLGGYIGGRMADRVGGDWIRNLATVELLIAVTGALSPLTFQFLPQLQFWVLKVIKPAPMVFFVIQMVLAFVVMIVPTTLMGATFPLASKLSVTSYNKLGRALGGLYSANNLGAIVGSLAAGFVLIPLIGVQQTIVFAGILNLVVSSLIMAVSKRPAIYRIGVGLAVVVSVGALHLLSPSAAVPLSLGTAYRFQNASDYRTAGNEQVKRIWFEENSYSTVSVFESRSGGFRFLVNGSLIEGSGGQMDLPTTSMLSLLPCAYTKTPRSIMVIGLGTGLTSRAALSTSARSVTTVEINPAMKRASEFFVGDTLEKDPRWRLVQNDARQVLQTSTRRYDVITSEPSWPLADSVAPLFTKEFFSLAKSHLNPGGTYCQWLPMYLLSPEDQAMMVRTFRSVFPDMHVWTTDVGGDSNGDLLLVGHRGGSHPGPDEVKRSLRATLKQQGVNDAVPRLIPLTRLAGLSNLIGANTMNTDDRPLLEFDVPKTVVLMGEGLR